MYCMFCKMLDRGNSNYKGEIWCRAKKDYVDLISPKCGNFVYVFGSEVTKEMAGEAE